MNSEIKEKLNDRLVKIVNYIDELKEQKKAVNASLSEQIKEADKKIKYLGRAIKNGDLTLLGEAFSPDDCDHLTGQRCLFPQRNNPVYDED